MNIIIDTCSLVNLFNSNVLDITGRIPNSRLFIGPSVLKECGEEHANKLVQLMQNQTVEIYADSPLLGQKFLTISEQYNLGAGETECISACLIYGHTLCSDDKRARSVANELLGEARVIGSLRLLRNCVRHRLIRCNDAFRHFNVMRAAGGFLPNVVESFFCAGLDGC